MRPSPREPTFGVTGSTSTESQVNLYERLLECFGALLLLIGSATGAARAAELVAAPLPAGGHVGSIVNRPTSVDRVIETTPNDARYFVGLMVWRPGELDEQIRAGTWAVRPADADTVLATNSGALWKTLSAPQT
jgi:hypothetical protein